MEILMFFCKGIHVIALSLITIVFLFRLYSKTPSNDENYTQQLNPSITNSHVLQRNKSQVV